MTFSKAITRKPGIHFAAGVTRARWYREPDYERICIQHEAYVDTLRSLGMKVVVLDADPDFPDAYFVEDTAIMLDKTALVTRPGEKTRRGEVKRITPILKQFRALEFIHAPGLLEGGDVLLAEKHFFVGLSERTNIHGAQQFGEAARRQGFTWSTAPVLKGLHLKTGVTYVGQQTLLMFEAYAGRPEFSAYNRIVVDEKEAPAANTLRVNGTLLTPKGFPKTMKKLEVLEMPIIEVDISEVIKMDGGLSCLSLRF